MDMSIGGYLEVIDVVNDLEASDDGQGIALRDCLVENYDRLHRSLSAYLGCRDQASECLHDAWLRLGDMAISTTMRNPEGYVYRVACNLAMDRLRSNRSWQYGGDVGAELEHMVDPLPGPDCIAEARFDLAALECAIRGLPPLHQCILMELRINERTRETVAAVYGFSVRRIDTLLRQALDHCAAQTGQRAMAGVGTARRSLPQARMRA